MGGDEVGNVGNMGGDGEGDDKVWGVVFQLNLSVVGVSVVDGNPQELMYLRTEGVNLERRINRRTGEDSGGMKIGSFGVDNQLWITPFPAMLRVGRGEENNAVEVNWTRDTRFRNDAVSRVTLVKKMTVKVQPVEMNLDGNLIIKGVGMALGMKGWGGEEENIDGRDGLLGKVMGIEMDGREKIKVKREGVGEVGDVGGGSETGSVATEGRGKQGGRKSYRKPLFLTGVEAASIRGREDVEEVEDEKGEVQDHDVVVGGSEGWGGGGEKEQIERKVYFEQLDVQPVQLKFSFILPLRQQRSRSTGEGEWHDG